MLPQMEILRLPCSSLAPPAPTALLMRGLRGMPFWSMKTIWATVIRIFGYAIWNGTSWSLSTFDYDTSLWIGLSLPNHSVGEA